MRESKEVPQALWIAAENGHKDCLNTLLHWGAVVKSTVVDCAMQNGHTDCANILLRHPANHK